MLHVLWLVLTYPVHDPARWRLTGHGNSPRDGRVLQRRLTPALTYCLYTPHLVHWVVRMLVHRDEVDPHARLYARIVQEVVYRAHQQAQWVLPGIADEVVWQAHLGARVEQLGVGQPRYRNWKVSGHWWMYVYSVLRQSIIWPVSLLKLDTYTIPPSKGSNCR